MAGLSAGQASVLCLTGLEKAAPDAQKIHIRSMLRPKSSQQVLDRNK
jgi:hypothetical protein